MINVTEKGKPEGCLDRQNYGKRETFLKVCNEKGSRSNYREGQNHRRSY
jgi:hypothetical protein